MTDPTPQPSEPVLSKNLAFGAVALIIILGLVGVVLLHLFRPDASATFIQTVVNFAQILIVAITTVYGLGKLGEKVAVVQRQTNGTLTALREEIERKEGVIKQLHDEKVELAKQVTPPAS